MFKELILVAIALAGGIAVSRLWTTGRRLWSALFCLALALLVTWLARRWTIDLSGVA